MFPLPGAWVNYSEYLTLAVRFTDPDGISLFSLSMTVDGSSVPAGWTNFAMYASITGLSDGPHAAEASAWDQVGNGPTVVSWSFSVDTVPPVVAITTPTGNPELVDGSVTLAWTGSDVGSGIDHYEVRLDGGSSVDVGTATSLAFPDLAPGVHYFQVTAYDVARNNDHRTTIATVPFPPGNSTAEQIPTWAIALVVVNAAEAAGVVWLALRRRVESSRGEKPAP
jgi:hypothetical protein